MSRTTNAKAIAAGVGATLTALITALGPLQTALDDGHIDVGEGTTLAGVAVTLVVTVYAVWRTPNKPVVDESADQSR